MYAHINTELLIMLIYLIVLFRVILNRLLYVNCTFIIFTSFNRAKTEEYTLVFHTLKKR
jgi:hypothetical protein